jgi:hypothetical protein
MNGFTKGMGSLNLFPPLQKQERKTVNSAWQDVGKAFLAVGNNLRTAMYEQSNQTSNLSPRK